MNRISHVVAAATGASIVLGMAVAGVLLAPPPVRPHLEAGSVWLTSRAVGLVTLVNGSTAEVSANVHVTGPDAHFDTEQVDSAGYAVDSRAGLIIGVDGATRQPRSTTVPAGSGDVYATADTLYVVAADHRSVLLIDSRTLTADSATIPLPASASSMVSDGRSLWVADNQEGVVTSYTTDGGTTTPNQHRDILTAGRSPAVLTVAHGKPVLVDTSAHAASLLTASGTMMRTMRLDVQENDLVSGSQTDDILLVVPKGRGTVVVCSFADRACQPPLSVTDASHDLGLAVELDGRVYVPDYTDSVVHVVDIAARTAKHTETLLSAGRRFELIQRDHFVYVNDPDSDQAGMVAPDARLTRISKYDPLRPSATRLTTGPHPTKTGPPSPSTLPVPTGSGHTTSAPSNGLPASGGTSTATTQTTATGPRIIAISSDPPTPQTGQEVTLTAQVAGLPDSWSWTVTRPDSTVEAASNTPQLKHVFTEAAGYTAKLDIAAGALHDSQTTTVTIVKALPTAKCGDTVTTDVLLTKDLDCTGTALTAGAADITIDLGGHSVRGSDAGIVVVGQPGVTVRSGSVAGGLSYQDSASDLIDHVHADVVSMYKSNNFTARDSALASVRGNVSDSPTFVGTTITGAGAFLKFSGHAFFTGCTVTGTAISIPVTTGGYTVENSTFVDSQLVAGQTDGGIVTGNGFTRSSIYIGTSRSTYVHQNTFTGAEVAVTIEGTQDEHNNVDLNTFDGNGIGVALTGPAVKAFEDTKITNNTFTDNGIAGISIDATIASVAQTVVVSGNKVTGNGRRADGRRDHDGLLINDGIHIDVPAQSNLAVGGNIARNNADYGIEAPPNTVTDAGGNTSRGDPRGCLGVMCR
jgi:hypothetical protein